MAQNNFGTGSHSCNWWTAMEFPRLTWDVLERFLELEPEPEPNYHLYDCWSSTCTKEGSIDSPWTTECHYMWVKYEGEWYRCRWEHIEVLEMDMTDEERENFEYYWCHCFKRQPQVHCVKLHHGNWSNLIKPRYVWQCNFCQLFTWPRGLGM